MLHRLKTLNRSTRLALAQWLRGDRAAASEEGDEASAPPVRPMRPMPSVGLRPVLLTGDHRGIAESVAADVDIDLSFAGSHDIPEPAAAPVAPPAEGGGRELPMLDFDLFAIEEEDKGGQPPAKT